MSLATVAAVVAIGGTAYGAYNSYEASKGRGGQGGVGGGSPYVPQGSGMADDQWQQLLQQLTGGSGQAAGAMNPAMLQAFQSMMGIDPSGAIGAGNQAGAEYGNLANTGNFTSGTMRDMAHTNLGAQYDLMKGGQQLWNTSLDPENALRNSLQQQVTDASRAGTSARGLGMSGVGAGIENKDVSDFLMNWQDRQLGRQSQGLAGMTGAYNQAGQQGLDASRNLTGAQDIQSMIPGWLLNSGMVPFQTQQQVRGAPFSYANLYNSGQAGTNNLASSPMSQIIQYLYAGQGGQNQAFNQGQTGLNNFTTGLQQLGQYGPGAWNSISSMFGPSQPYGSNFPPPDSGGYTDPYASGGFGT